MTDAVPAIMFHHIRVPVNFGKEILPCTALQKSPGQPDCHVQYQGSKDCRWIQFHQGVDNCHNPVPLCAIYFHFFASNRYNTPTRIMLWKNLGLDSNQEPSGSVIIPIGNHNLPVSFYLDI